MAKGFVITGTDTGIGKTEVACALITRLRQKGHSVLGMKPVASGCEQTPQGLRNADALRLQAAASMRVPYESINPYAFAPPIAPHIAAQEAGVDIDFSQLHAAAETLGRQADYLIIEGVGGWRVPLGKAGDFADLARLLGLPVILVIGIRLGCLNHAFLSADAIINSGLPLVGWVGNRIDPHSACFEQNLETLQARIDAPCLGVMPFLPDLHPGYLASFLNVDILP